MRKCHLVKKTVIDGETSSVTVYSGSQRSHMERLANHLKDKGHIVEIKTDPPQKRRVRINPLTNKPFNRITRKSYESC